MGHVENGIECWPVRPCNPSHHTSYALMLRITNWGRVISYEFVQPAAAHTSTAQGSRLKASHLFIADCETVDSRQIKNNAYLPRHTGGVLYVAAIDVHQNNKEYPEVNKSAGQK